MLISDENGDENDLMILETREFLSLVISGYLFENIFVKFGFVSDRVCDFAIMFTMNVINIVWFQKISIPLPRREFQ